ncbi:myelin expression factor 2 isoform X2 [Esox lucius]|uniref:myelin expression factor 2 isoform X2 n=1 Tax=Esox lucius TaxID=8010 RepID=UPI000661AA42|nr:myelin expression factor 2 isoform X2 [Esox lucius]
MRIFLNAVVGLLSVLCKRTNMADIVQETEDKPEQIIKAENEETSQDGTNGVKIEAEDEILGEDAPAEEEGLGDDEVLGDEVLGDDDTPVDGDDPIDDAEALADNPADSASADPLAAAPKCDSKSDLKEKTSGGSRRANRFHPYKEKHSSGDKKGGSHRNRVFISNIPYDMKWQAIKDLMREKVGEVTYVELFKDAEGKSRGCGVVEFKDEEFVKKAIEVMNKHDLNGRPLNIKEDPDGEHARRVLQRTGGMYPGGGGGGGRGQEGGPGGVGVPPSIANNPNVPPEVISSLRAGRLGTTVFVANLDFKVGWKKLKEVFGMAGTVKRADVKEDKDGKSRGMGTVTFEQALEAVQAISMFNGQMLFDRQMHVKMDDKSMPADDFRPVEKAPQLPRGLGGIGMGLGPGGQPINANRLSGGAMGNMGPAGMDGPGYGGMNRLGGGGFGGMDSMGGFGAREMGRMGEMAYRSGGGMGGAMERDFGRSDMSMSRGFGGMGMGGGGGYGGGMSSSGMGPIGGGLGGGMGSLSMDRMGSGYDRMGGGMEMSRGFGGYGGGGSGGSMSDRGSGAKGGCQIFVRNLSYDLTWQKLKEKFSVCGQVMFAEIKMEGGKSKGCGTVRFDSPESANKACRMMNGTKINGREVDVRIDRNA